jgi:hypothetical protein
VRHRVDKRHWVMKSVVARARAAGLDLEVMSDLSLIRFYYEMLRSGDFKAISYRKKKVMRGLGLLERCGGCGSKFVLTEKACCLLSRVEEEEPKL